jgi:TolB-like protein/Tfp pilus assembly protein PilF
MPEQSLPTGAIFLSYASEDAEAAARISESLRAAGIEVWFDRNELRGGDAWDSKIKKQIHDCALFVAVISAHTNARTEGYFRREWKLATRRLLDIADDAAFLVPVVIDDTREAHARVPEEFTSVQWTRLPDGETPPAFAKRVRQLLGTDREPESPAGDARSDSRVRVGSSRTRKVLPDWRLGVALLALLVFGGGVYWYYRSTPAAPAAKPASSTASSTAVAAPNDKSIAVLPFADMSQSKDQEYFADGLAEELINLLAQNEDLRVIGRTSSFQFKGKNADLRTIGQALNVAHVLEGSVRKSEETLRITAQLIRASDGSHLWSETFDRKLEDVFAMQDEIAAAVVGELKPRLIAGSTPVRATRHNIEAYNQYLQGRFYLDLATGDALDSALAHFQAAIRHDPKDALAWVGLSTTYAMQTSVTGQIPHDEGSRLAREAAERAVELDPALANAHAALGGVQANFDWDWEAAEASYSRAYELARTDPEVLFQASMQDFAMGRLELAATRLKKAIDRDPLRSVLYNYLAFVYTAMHRFGDAEIAARRGLMLSPDAAFNHFSLATALLLQRKFPEAELEFARELDKTWRAIGQSMIQFARGRRNEADASLKAVIEQHGSFMAFQIAEIYAFRGERDLAFEWLDRAYRQRDSGFAYLLGSPFLNGLRGDPRYAAMVRKLGLPIPA